MHRKLCLQYCWGAIQPSGPTTLIDTCIGVVPVFMPYITLMQVPGQRRHHERSLHQSLQISQSHRVSEYQTDQICKFCRHHCSTSSIPVARLHLSRKVYTKCMVHDGLSPLNRWLENTCSEISPYAWLQKSKRAWNTKTPLM